MIPRSAPGGFWRCPDGEIVVETLPGTIDVHMQNAYTQRDRIEPVEVEDDPWDKRLKELHYRK